jgi:uncharacterized membrane protein
MAKAQLLANAFGGLSSGIAVWYAAAPRHFLETIGIRPNSRRVLITRLVAAQEGMVGASLLMDGRAGRWLAMRVAGDAVHGVMLALATRAPDNDKQKLRVGWAAWLAITSADIAATIAANNIERTGVSEDQPTGSSESVVAIANGSTHRSVTINREPGEVYAFWRQLDNLPLFMKHLERVDVIDGTRSHWVAKAPLGRTVEWDAEVTEDVPNEQISWSSTGSSQIWNRGTVRFQRAPGKRGTEVHVELEYAPPGGPIGSSVARILGEEPTNQISGDLRRLKQVMETGDVIVSEAVAEANSRRQRPAQPIGVTA